MTARLRIRPRFGIAGGAAPCRPWRWIPLALLFRKRRLAARPAPVVAQAPSASPQPVSWFTRRLHYHTHQGARIFSRADQRETILREQTVVQSSPQDIARPDPASPAPDRHARERRVETRFSVRMTRDLEQAHTRIHRIERIARESDAAHFERISTSVVDTILLPAQQRFRAPWAWPNDAGRSYAARSRPIERTAEIRLEPPQSKIIRETHMHWRTAEPNRSAEVRASFAAPMPVPQVWRTQPGRESARETASPFSPAPAMAPASYSQLAATQLQTANQAPPPPAPRKPDEQEMDRLADNVMKRIERHVRIERERRGR